MNSTFHTSSYSFSLQQKNAARQFILQISMISKSTARQSENFHYRKVYLDIAKTKLQKNCDIKIKVTKLGLILTDISNLAYKINVSRYGSGIN